MSNAVMMSSVPQLPITVRIFRQI